MTSASDSRPTTLLPGSDEADRWREELESLHAISVEIAGLHQLNQVMDRALDYCLQLTESAFGFVGLIDDTRFLEVAAIKGFAPDQPTFWEHFRRIPIRPSVFGIVVIEGRAYWSNDIANDPYHVGAPRGHPSVHTFLGVPLRFRDETIGMIGVANRLAGYGAEHERLLATFANQVAVAITNARLYEQQVSMIADLRALHAQLDAAQVAAMLQQERGRIAEELHDRVAQILFSLGIGITWCLGRTPDETAQTLQRLRHLAAQGTEEIRRTVYDLAEGTTDARGLVEQLRLTVGAYTTGELQVNLVINGRPRRLPYEVDEALHRIALEALTNVQRHAAAEVAIVGLHFEPEEVHLVVQDDGVGAPALILDHFQGNLGHFGLKAMHRRMAALGGRLSLRNGEEGGLIVRATVPLPATTPVWAAPLHTEG